MMFLILSHIISYYLILSHVISCYLMLSHVISCYLMLSHVISCYLMLSHVISCYLMLSHVISCYLMLSHVISCYLMLSHVISCYLMLSHVISCYLMLSHVISCYLMLSHVISCYLMLSHVISCYLMLSHVISCYLMLSHVISCYLMLSHVISCYLMLSHVISCYLMLSHVISCYLMLSHVISCYLILSHIISYYLILSHIISYYLIFSHIISYYLILSHVSLGTFGTCGSARSPPRHVEWSWRMGEPQWDRTRPRKPWTKNRKSDLAMQCLVPWKFHGSPYCWICRNDKSHLFFLACTFVRLLDDSKSQIGWTQDLLSLSAIFVVTSIKASVQSNLEEQVAWIWTSTQTSLQNVGISHRAASCPQPGQRLHDGGNKHERKYGRDVATSTGNAWCRYYCYRPSMQRVWQWEELWSHQWCEWCNEWPHSLGVFDVLHRGTANHWMPSSLGMSPACTHPPGPLKPDWAPAQTAVSVRIAKPRCPCRGLVVRKSSRCRKG